jgi:hypothetical protein
MGRNDLIGPNLSTDFHYRSSCYAGIERGKSSFPRLRIRARR